MALSGQDDGEAFEEALQAEELRLTPNTSGGGTRTVGWPGTRQRRLDGELRLALVQLRLELLACGGDHGVQTHRLDGAVVQAVVNLLGNAVKFAAPGVQPAVHVRAESGEGRVRLRVEDNGIGIAPEHRERIFGVFERLHGTDAYPGTGIGLAIAWRGMARLGCQVGVESEIGRGSRFWIELPASPPA